MRTYYYEEAIPWTLTRRKETEEWRKLPFLGFLAGAVMSTGIWGVIACAWWVWNQWPA